MPWSKDKAKALFADVAQLAEQLTCNQQVNGSSPFIGSHFSVEKLLNMGP